MTLQVLLFTIQLIHSPILNIPCQFPGYFKAIQEKAIIKKCRL